MLSHTCQNGYYKKEINNKRIWRKENLCILLVSMQIGTATMENNMEAPQKNFKVTI